MKIAGVWRLSRPSERDATRCLEIFYFTIIDLITVFGLISHQSYRIVWHFSLCVRMFKFGLVICKLFSFELIYIFLAFFLAFLKKEKIYISVVGGHLEMGRKVQKVRFKGESWTFFILLSFVLSSRVEPHRVAASLPSSPNPLKTPSRTSPLLPLPPYPPPDYISKDGAGKAAETSVFFFSEGQG